MPGYHHGNLRTALIEAAVALGRQKGPDGVVLREVARQTGVSHNAAYRHFADRDELLHEAARCGLAELAERMRERTRAVHADDPRERARLRLREVGKAYVEFALTEPGLFAVGFAHAAELSELSGPFDLLREALDECVETGHISADKRPGAELPCWAGVHGFAMLYGTGPLRTTPAERRDADLAVVLDRIDDSLRAG